MRIAVTRPVSSSINRCELTHIERQPIDLPLARAQHAAYEECLTRLGCHILRLPEAPDLPDSVFVEDIAIVLDEIAILTRPGAESRRAETRSVATALAPFRPLARIEVPATLDGGDVLAIGRNLYVGESARSNRAGIEHLRSLIAPLGYIVTPVGLRDCLHLKSAVTQVAPDSLLINRRWVDERPFSGMRLIDIDPTEPAAANALRIGDTVVIPAANARTHERLSRLQMDILTVDVSELAKAEGGVTCCSLIFEEWPRRAGRRVYDEG